MSRPNRFSWFAAALFIVVAVAQATAGVWWLALLTTLLAAVVLLSPVLRSRWFGAFSTTALVVGMVWSVTVGLWVQAAFLAIVVWLGLRQDLPARIPPLISGLDSPSAPGLRWYATLVAATGAAAVVLFSLGLDGFEIPLAVCATSLVLGALDWRRRRTAA